MAEYVVRMADERGKVVEQAETGQSAAEIRDRFAQQGFLVYWVKPRGLLRGGQTTLRRQKVKLQEFVIFNQQFLTLIHAGLPIVQALDLLARRQKNEYFRSLLENVRERTKGGELLSDAFDAQGAFPKIYSTTMMAGEKSGTLEEVLGRYVGFQRMTLTFRKKLLSSLVYPAVLVVGVVVLLSVLVTFVVPKFADLFHDLGQPLPALTEFTISVALSIKEFIPLILVVLIAGGFLFYRWSKTPSGSQRLDRFRLKVPLYGSIWLRFQVAMFTRMLSTLLSGGLPLVTALDTASQSMNSRLLANNIGAARHRVQEGQSLAHSLDETKIFPELAVEMVEVGESTGALPEMLISVAEFFEEDVQNALSAAMALIEPAILIIMGVVVGFILISLYMPIFSIGSHM